MLASPSMSVGVVAEGPDHFWVEGHSLRLETDWNLNGKDVPSEMK